MSKRDYYDVLGVPREAAPDEIKRAYRNLARKLHPDRNPDDPQAEAQFKEATEAYAILSDETKRARYDRLGHNAFSGGGGFEGADFSSVSEIFEGLFGEVFGGRRRRQKRGRDIEVELALTFEEAALGVEKSVDLERPTVCSDCGGSGAARGTTPKECRACQGKGSVKYQRGFFSVSRECQSCNGRGRIPEVKCDPCSGGGRVTVAESLSVRIPAGVADGAVRSVRGAGESSGAGNGDLHVKVKVTPHPLFTRKDADVLCEIPVSYPQAALGSEVEVPTLAGKVTMKVPAGTQSGRTFRLRGKGIQVFGGAAKGDQLVTILVEVPEKLTSRQRELLEELAREMGEEVHPQQSGFLEKLRELFD